MALVYWVLSPSNKIYIGKTSGSFQKRKACHLSHVKMGSEYPFHKAIRKYKDKLIWKIHTDNLSNNEALNLESRLIHQFNTLVPNGYNCSLGGDGNRSIPSQEVRAKMSLAHKGKKQNKEWIDKRKKALKGHAVSAATRDKISQTLSRKFNKTGFKGVSFHKATGKFIVQKMIDGKKVYLGIFRTPEEAHFSYIQYHPEEKTH